MTEPSETKIDDSLDKELTQLISYLDGELDAGQITEVESQLVSNPSMRSHVDILAKTWSMLDDLDDVPASQTFTQDTMATIVTESVSLSEQTRQDSILPRLLTLLAAHKVVPSFLIGLLAGGVGLFLSGNIHQRQMEKKGAVIDRMVLENIDLLPDAGLYEIVPSAEILESLQLTEASTEVNQ